MRIRSSPEQDVVTGIEAATSSAADPLPFAHAHGSPDPRPPRDLNAIFGAGRILFRGHRRHSLRSSATRRTRGRERSSGLGVGARP